MESVKKARLTEGPIGWTLVKLTIPMIFAMIGMVSFSLIDTYFVGQLGTNELAALSFTFPVVLAISSFAMGLGVGTSSVISRAIGEGDQHRVQRLTTDTLMLSALTAMGIVIVGMLTIDPLFRLLGATPEVLELIREYMAIWYIGVLFIFIPMVGNNAIRATGDTKTPSMIMMVAVVVNLVLDPLLIFGIGPFPRLEVTGAAIATVIARAATLVFAMWVLYYREKMITFQPPALQEVLTSWRQLLHIALPAAGTSVIVPMTAFVVTSMVAVYGSAAVAAYGAASRIDMFAMAIMMALGSVLAPFVGQNWGANQIDRVDIALKYSHRASLLWGAVLFVVLAVAGRPIASLFNDNPDVITTMATYFWIVPLGYGLQGVILLSTSVLNVLGKPLYAAALMLTQTLLLYIPMAYAGSYLFGLHGIFAALVIANIIVGSFTLFWLRGFIHNLGTESPVLSGSEGLSVPKSEHAA